MLSDVNEKERTSRESICEQDRNMKHESKRGAHIE